MGAEKPGAAQGRVHLDAQEAGDLASLIQGEQSIALRRQDHAQLGGDLGLSQPDIADVVIGERIEARQEAGDGGQVFDSEGEEGHGE